MAIPGRICIDARPLAFPGNGNARYFERMLQELLLLRPDYEWNLVSHRALHSSFAGLLHHEQIRLEVDHGFTARNGLLWMNTRVPALVKRIEADLFWGTIGMLPWNSSRRMTVPTMVNFHDLNAFVAPDTMDRLNRWQHRVLDGNIIGEADLVICLSETTRRDIQRILPGAAARSRLEVVYPGADLPNETGETLERPDFPGSEQPYFLCVGTIEPRKNQATLIQAYRRARTTLPGLPPIVFIGRKGWGEDDLYSLLKSGKLESEGVYFIENAPEQMLKRCYKHAGALVLPSLHEGFGLPLVEAGLYGKRMIVSDIPIFREVAGPGAKLVEPENEAAWANALMEEFTGPKKKPDLAFFLPEKWSWSVRAAELAAHLDSLL